MNINISRFSKYLTPLRQCREDFDLCIAKMPKHSKVQSNGEFMKSLLNGAWINL